MTFRFLSYEFRFLSYGGAATDIRDITVTTDTEDSADLRHGIYDLQGRKLSHEPASGVYIKDGKKYVK